MKKYFLFGLFILFFLFGCDTGSNKVFIPEAHSGEEATKSVFVPAAKSGEGEEVTQPQVVPMTAMEAAAKVTAATVKGVEQGTPDADVLYVKGVLNQDDTWTFSVTVAHPDTGWEDYADGWDVLTLDGEVLRPDPDSPFTRLLLHPHETEQPFTRSQSNVVIPNGVASVRVRAHDLVDGYGGQEIVVDLTVDSGPGFVVERSD